MPVLENRAFRQAFLPQQSIDYVIAPSLCPSVCRYDALQIPYLKIVENQRFLRVVFCVHQTRIPEILQPAAQKDTLMRTVMAPPILNELQLRTVSQI